MTPIVFDADAVEAALPFPALVDVLAAAFARGDTTVPLRSQHVVGDGTNAPANTLLLMPAWRAGAYTGLKILSVVPGNSQRGLASVIGSYLLISGETGQPLALLDGTRLTLRRTAAASALAARYLARPDASRLLMVGAGSLAPHLIKAHASVRPIARVMIWNRDPAKAAALVGRLPAGLTGEVVEDLAAATAEADIISCATMSTTPLIHGADLTPGTHLDLVGGFTPAMHEADEAAVVRSRLYLDTIEGVLSEAGDILSPLASGAITRDHIQGELADLTTGRVPGRTDDNQITLFKSVGAAIEDLAAAEVVYRTHQG